LFFPSNKENKKKNKELLQKNRDNLCSTKEKEEEKITLIELKEALT